MMFKRPKKLHRAVPRQDSPPPAPVGFHWTVWTPIEPVDPERFRKTVCCNAPTRGEFDVTIHSKQVMVCICILCTQRVAEFDGSKIRWFEKDTHA